MIDTVETISDAVLVTDSLTGNREAFGQIVTRYQTLICSLAYSRTGSLSQSEDLAQETFIAAWKQLATLREPDKLRSWLCGIARNRIYDALKQQGREPSHAAEPLDALHESPAPELPPHDLTISKEEEAILWRAIERIPETYREPLILFYREHQSIETVAVNLELTEDAVKQRLSRGRKLLQEQVLAFVEGALARTNPGPTFTLGVLAALPAMTFSTKAATLGVAAVKGVGGVKTAGLLGLGGAVLSPLLFVLGNYSSYRMSMDEAVTDEERFHTRNVFKKALHAALAIVAVLAIPIYFVSRNSGGLSLFWTLLIAVMFPVYFLTTCFFVAAIMPARRRYLAQTLARECGGQFPPAAYEFCSRARLFGLPLLHVRIGDRFDVMRGPVKAWIAIGSSHAVGVIFASGGLAVAPVSFGGIAIGLLPFGALALGLFPLGALSFGVWAYGALAIGWQAFCGAGLAWNAAEGGIVFARDFALGGIAHAAQANTDAAKQFIVHNPFFRSAYALAHHGLITLLIWVVPVALQARIVARARQRRESGQA